MTNIVSKLTGVAAFSAAVAAALLQIYLRKQKTAHAGTLLRRAVIPRTTLTPHTIAVIRATAPVISRHVSEIVNRFYEIFFARHPEMRSLFSLSHGGGALEESDRDAPTRAMAVCPVRKNNSRKNVTGMQARAMAHTICAYAAQLADSDNFGFEEVVHKIANKHVSHNVTPDMYPLLGSCLLEAIFSVLDGVAANMDVVGAWTDAYWYLAETLMMEEDVIIEKMMAPGNNGWIGFKPFVVRKQIESESILSLYLTPEDGLLPLPLFQPGQYITLKITLPNGSVTHRNYSLSDSPGKNHFRISVKRVIGGEVSNYIHDVLRSGDKILLSVPCGTFTLSKYFKTQQKHRLALQNDQYTMPIVFISAGIGNTPFISMINSICDPKTLDVLAPAPVASGENSADMATQSKTPVNAAHTAAVQPENGLVLNGMNTAGLAAPTAVDAPMSTEELLSESAKLKGAVPILYIHAAKNKRHDAFFSHVRDMHDRRSRCRVITVYSQPRPVVDVPGKDYQSAGHVDENLLKSAVADPRNTAFFICGPDHFTRTQYTNILSIGGVAENIFYERFAPGGFSEQLSSKLSF